VIRNYWQHLYEQYQKMLSEQKQVFIDAEVSRNAVTQKWFIWDLDPLNEIIELAPITVALSGKLPNNMTPDRQVYTTNELSADTHLDIIGMLEQEETWIAVRFIQMYDDKNQDTDYLLMMTEENYKKYDIERVYVNTYKQLPISGSFERIKE